MFIVNRQNFAIISANFFKSTIINKIIGKKFKIIIREF